MLEELILEATRAVNCPSANPADLTQTFKREVLDRDEFYIFGKHVANEMRTITDFRAR